MPRLLACVLVVLVLAGSRLSWARDREAAYPAYEPPEINLDQAIAPAAPEPAPAAPLEEVEPPPAAPVVDMPAEPVPPDQAETPPPPAPPVLKNYKVYIWQENGDCLWRIAQKIYGDKDKWNLIYMANRDVIKDPNKIYPKQKLKIPPPDWQP